ncbi:hypothetical protein DFH07DRAFT_839566 [Mycena maculata]|uniref:Uncharacterized protein n=1 Tax=Mycena maculata TaxID=230809 RepID=A0AAD7IEF6_9AGAR|nr:hypothetical protein DFH07DRAFT_839566 [Mycena maculata]
MSNATYRPDESNAAIFSEHTWLQGAFLAAVAYGMETILYAMSVHLLWTGRKEKNKKRNFGLIVYITIIFILGTLYMAGLLQFTQQSFIDDRNIEGGPNTYEDIEFSIPIDMLANVIMVMLTWMCDIVNVWRCSIIYRGAKVPLYVVLTIPSMMYMASIALGTLFLKQVGTVSASPWDTPGVNWTIPYYTMSLSLNILVTILIVIRLLVCRAQITRAMGKTHGAQYTSLAAMIIESAAIYSSFSLLFLVPFALNTTTSAALSQLWLQALSPVQVVSTLLIIFRVAQGKSWNQNTIATITEPSAASNTVGGSRRKTSAIQFQTNVVTTYSDIGSKGAITLQSLEASQRTRTVDFDETKTTSGPTEEV